MNNYPLKEISREVWQKKVNSTSMYTIPAQDEAFPILQQLSEMLTRLLQLPLTETLDQSLVQYFFTGVFPTVCQKIIRSRYFKNPQVLKVSNQVLQKCVYLTPKYIQYSIKYPRFLQILTTVFQHEQFYFKNNNLLSYMLYPYSYFPQPMHELPLQLGQLVDIIKIGSLYQKVTWSQGKIIELDQYEAEIQYLYDGTDKKTRIKRDSVQVAQHNTKSKKIFTEWRMNLKVGDLVDVQDSFGSWYNGTILEINQREQGKKNVKVTLKVYHENGNKQDQKGTYYGFSQYEETLDFTSAKLAPFGTVAKQYCYQSSKAAASFDSVQDINDYQFPQINGQKIFALPRKKYLSQFQFQTINQFGRKGGFDKYLDYLEKQMNFDILCYFVKGISGVTPYLNRELVKNLVDKIKCLFQKYLFGNGQKPTKSFTKQQSEMTFSGLKALQKRLYSNEYVSKYENTLKMKLADICLQSQAIKNKLLGLNQLKDIVRSVTYVSDKNKYIRQWVKSNKIFEKIYMTNSHVQLIKKSEQFFKYLINENILQVTDLQRLYKLAQKGDFQSRVSLYKLFQEVSHIFKKQHVQFLIDTILQSQLNLILNQDIDLLHQLSRFSNYFPLQKVIKFFENIILSGENKVKQLNQYAIKRYSQIVSKNPDVKPYRRSIIKNFLSKLQTNDITQITKVLKGIFEGIGIGDWDKKDLNEILADQKVDQVVVQTLKKYKGTNQFSKAVTIMQDFLLSIFKLSHKIKINLKILDDIWEILEGNQQKQRQFYRWANEISKCEQGFQNANGQQLQNLYRKLFTPAYIPDLQGSQFQLAKNFFVEINKKSKYISVVNTFKQRQMQKQYRRKTQMKNLKLIDIIIQMVYNIKSQNINNQVLSFFIQLYTSKQNSQNQIDQYLNLFLQKFKTQYELKNYSLLVQTIKLLEVVINDSQKSVQTKVNSLISKKQADIVKFIIINQLSYISSQSLKKSDMFLPMNTPIIKLRKMLAKSHSITWQQLKIISNKQITDYDNSRTLKQLKLSPSQPLTISRRVAPSLQQQQLILNDELNPKAIRCFKSIFEKYSTNGKMDKNQCTAFTIVCLGSTCSTKHYNQKISSLYGKYDEDNDGLLTIDNFLRFYQDAAKDRPSTVWSNLRSFDVKGDFRFGNEPQQLVEVTKYPRNIIAQYPKVYDILFDLLHIKQVASVAFQLLQRLPVSKSIQQKLLNIQTGQDLQKILSTQDLYELFYKLNIIQYLAHSTQLQTQLQKKWHVKFIQFSGYQILYNSLKKIVGKSQYTEQMKDIIRQIQQTSLNLLNQYWLECFSSDPKKVRLSLSFISTDQDIDDKMDYLVYGRFFKSQKKLQPRPNKLPKQQILYSWKGQNKKQLSTFVKSQLKQKWTQIAQTAKTADTNQKRYSLTMLLNKLLDTLNILNLNEDSQQMVELISQLLQKVAGPDLLRRFYCFILSQCFFAKSDKYQGIYIRQLFKNLTKKSITSQHFRVLAVLVSKYGIKSMSDSQQSQQATLKLKQVLFNNVLNNNNQLTVQGCAKLLSNFNLQGTTFETFQKIWSQKLFNPLTFNQKQQSKQTLYQLILKICKDNSHLVDSIIKKVLDTLSVQLKNMKIVYCNEFKQRSSTGYAGLKNLGSTCYINSMIQQLYMNRNFRYCILRADDNLPPNDIATVDNKNQVRTVDDNFLHQLQRIFANLELTNRIDFAPRDFCVAYKPFGEPVNVLIQQDVQQFVSMFFDRLEAGLANTIFKRLVSDFYIGKTTNLFKCHTCQKTKKVQETFHSISLQVKTSKTLAQSFNRFCHGQMITDYKCQFCNNKVDVTKKTRVSVAPKILIIHLQRIVFNLDTFINQKITTKHSFPNTYNLYQASLDYYQRSQAGQQLGGQAPSSYNYNLIGIICHSGTAQSGHYISYIKTSQNKWIQFNDTQVTSFNASNIESQCFGGYFATSSFDDQYYQQKKESSKSAYLLIYEKEGANTIEVVINKRLEQCKNQKQRQKVKKEILDTLDLNQVINKIKSNTKNENVENAQQALKAQETDKTGNVTPNIAESHQQSSSAPQDSQNQTKLLLQQKQLQIRRHQSEDNIQTNLPPVQMVEQKKQAQQKQATNQQKGKQTQTNKQQIVYIQDPVSPYIGQNLKNQIMKDNQVHFFEKCLSSSSFVKFFSMLISQQNSLHKQILPICQKLTFGFWLKSPSFKDLLNMMDGILKIYPAGFEGIVTNNPAIISLLIQSSDADIRTAMANFLSKVISDTIEAKNINIHENRDDPIFKFLDSLFLLLPSTVSRCWTKFGQYFQFWYELSNKGQKIVQYMVSRDIIKHFMDYFLDAKSPLKIYATKRQHQIGSSYANPNFSMLLKCVFSLLQQRMVLNQKIKGQKKSLSSDPDQQKLLMSFESLQKLISENYENVAAQLVKQICPNNLVASQKAAIVILKGISKSNSQNIQPYLQVLHEFCLIKDQFQPLRVKWVIGKQTLAISNLSLKIIALNSYSLSQRIHNFQSSINLQSGSSLLQPILTYYNRIQTLALLCTKQLFRLCQVDQYIREYVYMLESPTLMTCKFIDFFKAFVDKYYEDHKKSYGFYSSSSGFNREQFGKQVKELYARVVTKMEEDVQSGKYKQFKEIGQSNEQIKSKQENKTQTQDKQKKQNQQIYKVFKKVAKPEKKQQATTETQKNDQQVVVISSQDENKIVQGVQYSKDKVTNNRQKQKQAQQKPLQQKQSAQWKVIQFQQVSSFQHTTSNDSTTNNPDTDTLKKRDYEQYPTLLQHSPQNSPKQKYYNRAGDYEEEQDNDDQGWERFDMNDTNPIMTVSHNTNDNKKDKKKRNNYGTEYYNSYDYDQEQEEDQQQNDKGKKYSVFNHDEDSDKAVDGQQDSQWANQRKGKENKMQPFSLQIQGHAIAIHDPNKNAQKLQSQKPKRGNRDTKTTVNTDKNTSKATYSTFDTQYNENYDIVVVEEKQKQKQQPSNDKDKNKNKQINQLNFTDQQAEQPLMKAKDYSKNQNSNTKSNNSSTKQKDIKNNSSTKEATSQKQQKVAWHPVKFQYNMISLVPIPQEMVTSQNIKIQQHLSTVTYVLTKPTGTSNRSFSGLGGSLKNYQRLSEEVWKNKREVKVHGFYIKNNSREGVRVFTDDGTALCKSGQNLFVWADKIIKVRECFKNFDWPKWSMYTANSPVNNVGNSTSK